MAHTDAERLQGVRWPREEECLETTWSIPLYPPNPSQREEWSQLLSEVPEVEPTFCRDVNGLMPGMDRRLRAIGNGVVPAVAATAWLNLTEKLTGVINENSNTRTPS